MKFDWGLNLYLEKKNKCKISLDSDLESSFNYTKTKINCRSKALKLIPNPHFRWHHEISQSMLSTSNTKRCDINGCHWKQCPLLFNLHIWCICYIRKPLGLRCFRAIKTQLGWWSRKMLSDQLICNKKISCSAHESGKSFGHPN